MSISDLDALRSEVGALNWYHTIALRPGVVTPGMFDHRTTLRHVPLPRSLAGLRCLDVGTHDGYWAFEMERRGAAEVVAVDLDDVSRRDWPLDAREAGPARLAEWGWLPGPAFRLAARALGSRVRKVDLNVYDLSPEVLGGRFDVVFLGSLVPHLRDPVRALEACRSVCAGRFVMADAIDPQMELRARGIPAARIDGLGYDQQWMIPNRAGLARMASSAGFAVRHVSPPYVLPFGTGPWVRPGRLRQRARNLAVARDPRFGVPHAALVGEPGR